jgi:hypothetical protein
MKCVPGWYSLGSMTRTSQQLSRGRARKREPAFVAGARRKNPISHRNARGLSRPDIRCTEPNPLVNAAKPEANVSRLFRLPAGVAAERLRLPNGQRHRPSPDRTIRCDRGCGSFLQRRLYS